MCHKTKRVLLMFHIQLCKCKQLIFLLLLSLGKTFGVAFLLVFTGFYSGCFQTFVSSVWSVGHEGPAHINQWRAQRRSCRWLAARCAAITELRDLLSHWPRRAQVQRTPRSVWRRGQQQLQRKHSSSVLVDLFLHLRGHGNLWWLKWTVTPWIPSGRLWTTPSDMVEGWRSAAEREDEPLPEEGGAGALRPAVRSPALQRPDAEK